MPRTAVAAWTMPAGLEGRAHVAVDLIAEASTPPRFVIDRLVEAGDVMLITGVEKDSYKTWLALSLALARTTGGPWLGFDVERGKPGRVLFVSTETRGTALVRRLISMCEGTEIDAAVAAKYLVVIDEPITMVSAADRARVYEEHHRATNLAALRIPNLPGEQDRKSKLRESADALGNLAVDALGQNIDLLDAISVPDTWSLIVIDTLRQCLSGDENSSKDAAAFNAAVRELARTCGCVVVVIHHSNKSGAHGEARSSRGSGEIPAGPDALVTIDASGEYPTAHFRLRNHEPVEPIGYKLVVNEGGVRLDVLPPSAGSTKNLTEDDVLAPLRAHPADGLTVSTIRKLIAMAKGGKAGAKANPKAVQKHLDALTARSVISTCEITQKFGKALHGYRLGSVGGRVSAVRISDGTMAAEGLGGPEDV